LTSAFKAVRPGLGCVRQNNAYLPERKQVLKKTITYKNLFTDETISEDFYFHLSKAELIELEVSRKGGLSESIQKMIDAGNAADGGVIVEEFRKILLKSYGQRSDDGRRFMKSKALSDEFESTEAYSELFMELITDMDKLAEFINGIIPKGMEQDAAQIIANAQANQPQPALTSVPTARTVTRVEMMEMNQEDLVKLQESIASGEAVLSE
jgi:hypothetical protein